MDKVSLEHDLQNKTNQGITEAKQNSWYLLFFAWLIAISGTLISLFFSEILKLPVCSLCWYQRIALYPLAIMLPLALFPLDIKVIRYVTPLVILGWFIALFHVLVVAGVIPESAQPCVQGIPCSEIHFSLFGFVNIPVMSLVAFSLLWILLFFIKQSAKHGSS